jgi:hypothetical protein
MGRGIRFQSFVRIKIRQNWVVCGIVKGGSFKVSALGYWLRRRSGALEKVERR